MAEKNASQEFRLKNIDKNEVNFIEEINGNDLISKKLKKVWMALNYIEYYLS